MIPDLPPVFIYIIRYGGVARSAEPLRSVFSRARKPEDRRTRSGENLTILLGRWNILSRLAQPRSLSAVCTTVPRGWKKDGKEGACAETRPLKYIPSVRGHTAHRSRDSVYVQTGGRGRENVGSCRRGSLTVRTILACSSLYRLGENYGQDSNKKDTTLSRLCFYLPYTSAFRQLHTYACVYIYIEGRTIDPLFWAMDPRSIFLLYLRVIRS